MAETWAAMEALVGAGLAKNIGDIYHMQHRPPPDPHPIAARPPKRHPTAARQPTALVTESPVRATP